MTMSSGADMILITFQADWDMTMPRIFYLHKLNAKMLWNLKQAYFLTIKGGYRSKDAMIIVPQKFKVVFDSSQGTVHTEQ
jgi:hypothetical protein